MSEENKKVKKPRQEWHPNILLQLLYRVWMVIFGVAKIALGAVATVVIIVAICMLAFATALGNYLTDEILPQAGMNLDDFTLDQTSFVYYYDSNGEIKLLQQIHTDTDRQWADYEDIPQDLINATIAVEDKRFYEHQGVDWFTTIKAFASMFMGDDSKGGSTITQQLVKNLTQDNSVTVQRKLLEIFRATDMERRYEKDTIMEWYLNYIYLGHGCYGVRSAAEYYFGKELEMLTTAECASLISITNNPSVFSPYGSDYTYVDEETGELVTTTGVSRNNTRKETTLGEMVFRGMITWEEYEEAMAQEIVFQKGVSEENRLTTCTNPDCGYENIAGTFVKDGDQYYCPECGSAVTVKEDASQDVYSWFVDTVLEDVAKMLCARDGLEWTTGESGTRRVYMDLIAKGGFHIYTTLDMDVQNEIDRIYQDLDEIPDTRSGQQLKSAIVIIDNKTGYIVGMAGDVGKKEVHDAWNIATDGGQQTGSSIKPLTAYGPAFEAGLITPATVIKDLPNNYDDGSPYPQNDNRRYSYTRSIYSALEDSVNAVAANLVDLAGIGYSFEFGKYELGLNLVDYYYNPVTEKEMSDRNLASLGLGALTHGLTVREMATAFATFPNDGQWRSGITFTKVFDSDGNVVLENEQEKRDVFSEKTTQYMNLCLTNAVNQGTGYEAKWDGYYGYVSGKTGTSADSKDRWFCGYTNYYTAAVWTGYEIPETIYVYGSINNPAAYLFRQVMRPLHSGLEKIRTYDSSNFYWVDICLDSGLLATDACRADARNDDDFDRIDNVPVYWEDRPTETCDKHVMMDFCLEGDGVANEWCLHFANDAEEADRIKVEKRGLCRTTREELDEMLKAKEYRLWEEFLLENWVYLVDERGRDDNSYKGLEPGSEVNKDIDSPYKVCSLHTQEAWEAYLASQVPEPTEPEPTEPGEGEEGGNPFEDWWGNLFP
ncbi:MAG: transglycosylase domain-containing protein [Oscillospiraceae bacterium]|nr:transglycosylase domain-containing protein [Oscillospiraceae bacterium]